MTGTHCYCDAEAEAELLRCLASHPVQAVHFLDSGNYHYLSALWQEQLAQPFTLALFDRHTDLQLSAFGDLLSCGLWVRRLFDTHPGLCRGCIVGATADPAAEAAYAGRVVCVSVIGPAPVGGTPCEAAAGCRYRWIRMYSTLYGQPRTGTWERALFRRWKRC